MAGWWPCKKAEGGCVFWHPLKYKTCDWCNKANGQNSQGVEVRTTRVKAKARAGSIEPIESYARLGVLNSSVRGQLGQQHQGRSVANVMVCSQVKCLKEQTEHALK